MGQKESKEMNSMWSNVSWVPAGGCTILDLYRIDDILRIIRDPMTYNEEARALSRALYSSNGIITNVIDYMVALPVLNPFVVPHGDSAGKKRKNKQAVLDIWRSIRGDEVLRDGLHGTLVEGVYFAYFETIERPLPKDRSMDDWTVANIVEINDANVNAAVISLNPDYTRIVGIVDGTYRLAFDLSYFDLHDRVPTEVKLRQYPKEIRKAYNDWKNGKGKQWAVLSTDHTIAVKYRAKRSEPYGRPLALAAIDDVLYDASDTKAKRAALAEVMNRIYWQEFPQGAQKGQSALTGPQQEKQHETVRDALQRHTNGDSFTTFFSVAAGTNINALKPDVSILNDDTDNSNRKKISQSLGFAGSLLTGEGTSSFSSQENNLQLITAQIFQIIGMLTTELNKVINRCVIRNPKYRTEVQFLPITYCNRKAFVEMVKDLYLQGKGSLALWASAVGVSPEAFFDMLDEELENGVELRYPVHQTSFTYTGKSNEAGRPTDEDTQNPKTLNNRANASNDTPHPETE